MNENELEKSAVAGKPGERSWSASRVTALLELIQSVMLFLAGVFCCVGIFQTSSGLNGSAVKAFTASAGAILFSLTLRAEARSRRGEGSKRVVNVYSAMTVLGMAIYICLNLFLPER
jgi:hypothetical protein